MGIQEEVKEIVVRYMNDVKDGAGEDTPLGRGIVAYVESRRYERAIEAIGSNDKQHLEFVQGSKRESTLGNLVTSYATGKISSDEAVRRLKESQQSLEAALKEEGFDVEIERKWSQDRQRVHEEGMAKFDDMKRKLDELKKYGI